MPPVTIVIPCYNEATRMDVEAYVRYLLQEPPSQLLFVDDGSTDGTPDLLQDLCDCNPDHCQLLQLESNGGKAEAVRQGVLHALQGQPQYIGYWDADLATPLNVIGDFIRHLQHHPEFRLIMGARVCLLGRSVKRHPVRHYLGRLFAAAASLTLRLPVYDTQCGAKLFRVTDTFESLFQQPFVSQWIFDVEILARLATLVPTHGEPPLSTCIYEWPLRQWHDVHGSKVRATDFLGAALNLLSIYWRYRHLLPANIKELELDPVAINTAKQDISPVDRKTTTPKKEVIRQRQQTDPVT
jgi:dolichyl-phosphate beta-glucosyltransferase